MSGKSDGMELDEFEQFMFRAHSPSHLMIERVENSTGSGEESSFTGPTVPLIAAVLATSNEVLNNGINHHKEVKRNSIVHMATLSPPSFSPNVDRSHLKLGRSHSCKPRVRPRGSDAGYSLKSARSRTHSLVTELNDLKDLSRHGSISSTTRLEDGGEIYRVRSFTTHHRGFINRGDSFKFRSRSARNSLIRKRQDSIISITGLPLNLGLEGDLETPDIVTGDADDPGDTETAHNAAEGASVADEDIPEEPLLEETEDTPPPPLYSVLISGAPGVGKTTLQQQLMTSEYLGNDDYLPGEYEEKYVESHILLTTLEEIIMNLLSITMPLGNGYYF